MYSSIIRSAYNQGYKLAEKEFNVSTVDLLDFSIQSYDDELDDVIHHVTLHK